MPLDAQLAARLEPALLRWKHAQELLQVLAATVHVGEVPAAVALAQSLAIETEQLARALEDVAAQNATVKVRPANEERA